MQKSFSGDAASVKTYNSAENLNAARPEVLYPEVWKLHSVNLSSEIQKGITA